MAFREETIESAVVYEGPVFRVRKHKVHAVGGRTAYRDVVEHNGGAVMVAVLSDGRILLERQFRKTVERDMIELPAGKRDEGEDFTETAIRELREETGYTPEHVEHLTSIHPSCGYTSERLDIFLCTGLSAGETDPDDTEDIEIFAVTPDEAIRMIEEKTIMDAKTIVGILLARSLGRI